jgi:hypothetical protein
MSSSQVKIASFDGTKLKFKAWSHAIIGLLTTAEALPQVQNLIPPAEITEPIMPDLPVPAATEPVWKVYDRKVSRYNMLLVPFNKETKKRAQAAGVIAENVTPGIYKELQRAEIDGIQVKTHAWYMWRYLHNKYAYDYNKAEDYTDMTTAFQSCVYKQSMTLGQWFREIEEFQAELHLSETQVKRVVADHHLLSEELAAKFDQYDTIKTPWEDIKIYLQSHEDKLLRRSTHRIDRVSGPTAVETTLICHNCHNSGHISSSCKSDMCGHCGTKGHVSAFCPNRKTTRDGRGRGRGTQRGGRGRGRGRISTVTTPQNVEEDTDDSEGVQTFEEIVKRQRLNMIKRIYSIEESSDDEILKRWRVDSGAAVHCCTSQKELSDNVSMFEQALPLLQTYNNEKLYVTGTGTATDAVTDVHIVPSGAENIISTQALRAAGYWVIHPPISISPECAVIVCDEKGQVEFLGNHDMTINIHTAREKLTEGNRMKIRLPELHYQRKGIEAIGKVPGTTNFLQTTADVVHFWHCSLAHMSKHNMCTLAENPNFMPGFPLSVKQLNTHWFPCIACTMGQAKKKTLKRNPTTFLQLPQRNEEAEKEKAAKLTRKFGYKISSDFFGPFPASINERKLAITFLAEPGGFLIIQICRNKTEIIEATRRVLDMYRANEHHNTEKFQSDHEAIYGSQQFRDLLTTYHITPQRAAPYTHEQAGGIERMAQTLGNKMATLLAAAPWIPLKLWEYAMAYATLGINITPKKETGEIAITTPYEKFYNKHFETTRQILLPFGTPVAYLLDAAARNTKLGPHVALGAYLGPATDSKGAIDIWSAKSNRVVCSRNFQTINEVPNTWTEELGTVALFENTTTDDVERGDDEKEESTTEADKNEAALPPPLAHTAEQQPTSTHYGTRSSTKALKNMLLQLTGTIGAVRKPHDELNPTLRQALASPQSEHWRKALQTELQQMDDMEVFQYIDCFPAESYPIYLHFVLKGCKDADGAFTKYKARLVALAQNQNKATYAEIKSPTASASLVKLFVALAAKRSRPLVAFDIPGAYLHTATADAKSTPMTPDIFVHVPKLDSARTRPARLLKFIYGLKQSGLEWFYNHSKFLIALGYKQSLVHPCLFTWRETQDTAETWTNLGPKERYHFVLVYVDDDLTTGSDDEIDRHFFEQLSKRYGRHGVVKEKKGTISFIGYLITQDQETGEISLSMPAYTTHILESTNTPLDADHPTLTPETTSKTIIPPTREELEPADPHEYLSILGLINFLAVSIRGDLLTATSKLATECKAPTVGSMKRMRRVLRYIASTRHLKIVFPANPEIRLVGYVDAAFNTNKGASRTGYCFALSDSDPSFYCRSAKQALITMSSTEAEYVAFYDAILEIMWLRYVLNDLAAPQIAPTTLFEDNQSAIALSQGFQNFQRTKHFNLRLHFIRAAITDRMVVIPEYIQSKDQRADALSKQLSSAAHLISTRNLLIGNPR